MLVGILLNEPEVLRKDVFAKLRVPLAEFEAKDREERVRYLLAEIGRTLGRRNGVDAFECLLAFFDLSGEVDENIKKLFWEAHHMRNVIVHRASLADRRLIDACPWLKLQINDSVTVSHKFLQMAGRALCDYVLIVTHRLGKRYNVDTHGLIERARRQDKARAENPMPAKAQIEPGGEPIH
jgi:hypothetical protein